MLGFVGPISIAIKSYLLTVRRMCCLFTSVSEAHHGELDFPPHLVITFGADAYACVMTAAQVHCPPFSSRYWEIMTSTPKLREE